MKCNSNIYFNKQCLHLKVIPAFAGLKVPYTTATSITQRKALILFVKDYIKFLYQKKQHLNRELYKVHLKAAAECGTLWNLISTSILDIPLKGLYNIPKPSPAPRSKHAHVHRSCECLRSGTVQGLTATPYSLETKGGRKVY
jgi:hypothetical protein